MDLQQFDIFNVRQNQQNQQNQKKENSPNITDDEQEYNPLNDN